MGDKVKNLVSGYIEELAAKKAGSAPKMATFSIRMSEHDHARLIWLAKNLDTQKAPLAERLLNADMTEAIEQYANWASGDPEKFLEEDLTSIRYLEQDPKSHREPNAPPHKPPRPKHHGPVPKHPK